MNMHARRSGFALPMAILLIGFMTAGLVAAFTRSEAESRTVEHLTTELEALTLAQAGLDSILARGEHLPTMQLLNLTGGTARVWIDTIRRPAHSLDTTHYLIRSEGRTPNRGPVRPEARRTVAQLAYRVPGTMHVMSAWTSLSGLSKAGGSGDISGYDGCNEQPPVAGVAVPSTSYVQAGQGDVIDGVPAVDYRGTKEQLTAEVRIDWNGIVDPASPALMPGHVLCYSGSYGYDPNWPCGPPLPSTFQSDLNYWPVVVINGSASLPVNQGRGTLIVTGDLTLGGNNKWDGIILVGGKIVDNGSGDINGAVITGLNLKRPEPWPSTVGESSKAHGTKDYTYNSCDVRRAASGFNKLTAIPNTWLDSWSWN